MSFRLSIITFFIVLLSAAALLAADGDWPMARYDDAQTGYTPQKLALPISLCWQYNATRYAENPSAPAVAGGVAYFASGNKVYALESATGTVKWMYPRTDVLCFNVKTGITIWEDLVIFGGTDGVLYALTAEDGRPAWSFPTKGSIRSTPVIAGGSIFVGSDDNSLYAIDARTGESIWGGGFSTKDDVQSPAAIAPGMVIFASMDANIYAANIATGKFRWSFRLPVSPVRSAPVVSGNLVYIAAGRVVYALSLKSGQLRYTIELPADIAAPPAIAGNDLFVLCRNKKLCAFTVGLQDPKAKWASAVDLGMNTMAPPTIAGDVVYIAGMRGTIRGYSVEDGKLVWSYALSPSLSGNDNRKTDYTDIAAPIVIANGALYALSDDGALHCFRSKAADNTPPKIFKAEPDMGIAMSGSPPITLSAVLYDESTGIDPSSVALYIDDDKTESTFDQVTSKVSYETAITQPLRPLKDGRHTVKVFAKDWKGNALTHTWSFVVDNTLPPRAIPKSAKDKQQKQRPKFKIPGQKGKSDSSKVEAPSEPEPDMTPAQPSDSGSTNRPTSPSNRPTPPTPPMPPMPRTPPAPPAPTGAPPAPFE